MQKKYPNELIELNQEHGDNFFVKDLTRFANNDIYYCLIKDLKNPIYFEILRESLRYWFSA